MNQRPSNLITLDKALEGFLYFKIAEGVSESTIVNYRFQLKKWREYVGNEDLAKVNSASINKYLSWLRTEYQPRRFGRDRSKLSGKSLRNHWVTLKAFFRWLELEFEFENVMAKVPAPKFTTPVVKPFSREEIEALLRACKLKRIAKTLNRKPYRMKRPTNLRDRSSILFLLDTGVRANEFCSFNIADFDPELGQFREIEPGWIYAVMPNFFTILIDS
jgi:integrase/recombinase XerD